MSTDAIIGYGVLFRSGDGGAPEAFATLGEVTNITPPAISRDSIDATHMQSPDAHREFILGLTDGGEVSIEMNFVPGSAGVAALLAEFETRVVRNRQIVFPNGYTWSFAAGLTGFETEAPIDDKATASATFKISGKPILAPTV